MPLHIRVPQCILLLLLGALAIRSGFGQDLFGLGPDDDDDDAYAHDVEHDHGYEHDLRNDDKVADQAHTTGQHVATGVVTTTATGTAEHIDESHSRQDRSHDHLRLKAKAETDASDALATNAAAPVGDVHAPLPGNEHPGTIAPPVLENRALAPHAQWTGLHGM
ncbi:Uncharacterized protein PBTT_08746 [Plasmodiophora brassicae]